MLDTLGKLGHRDGEGQWMHEHSCHDERDDGNLSVAQCERYRTERECEHEVSESEQDHLAPTD